MYSLDFRSEKGPVSVPVQASIRRKGKCESSTCSIAVNMAIPERGPHFFGCNDAQAIAIDTACFGLQTYCL